MTVSAPKDELTWLLSLCLPAIGATTPQILHTVDQSLQGSRFDAELDTIQIALAEALNNVIEHGYGPSRFGAVAVELHSCAETLRIHVFDWGQPYPGLSVPEAELPDPEALEEGGYGWFLIKTLMSEVAYERDAAANHLTLTLHVQ